MEDILDVYQRPYDPLSPVVCLDETSKELRSTPRGSILTESDRCKLEDYEYERHGTRNLFLWVEPLVGKRRVQVTKRRTLIDFAEVLRQLVDEDFRKQSVSCLLRTISIRTQWQRFTKDLSRKRRGELPLKLMALHCRTRELAQYG